MSIEERREAMLARIAQMRALEERAAAKSAAASFISGTVLRVDGARPQARMGWDAFAASPQVQQRDAVKPFDGFHRYRIPKVFE